MTQPSSNEDHAGVRPNVSKSFPNLYELLNVAPLEQRPEEIVEALRLLQRTLPTEPSRETTTSRRARKIIELAEKHLLNEPSKQAYDRKWKQHFAARSGIAVEVPQPLQTNLRTEGGEGKDVGSLDSLFPRGDPDQPFDLPAYLSSIAGEQLPHPELEFQKLQRLLVESRLRTNPTRSQPAPGQSLAAVGAGAAIEQQPIEPRSAQSAASNEPRPRQAFNEKLVQPQWAEAELTGRRVHRRNRRRKSPRWVALLALIASVGLILGSGFWLLKPAKNSATKGPVAGDLLAQSTADRGVGLASLPTVASNSDSSKPPRQVGSGLPKPGEGIVASFGVDLSAAEQFTSAHGVEPKSLPVQSNTAKPPTMPTVTVPPDELPTMAANLTKPETADLPADPMKTGRVVTGPVESKLSPSERDAWTEAMIAAKKLIGEQQFDTAEKKLSDLNAKARTTAQTGQHQRLSAINKLAREFCRTLVNAIAGLGAGEVVKVGTSTQASFVAGSPTELTVRVSGENRRYSLNQIPIGLAYALVDLKLDNLQPNALALKAAFALVHPKSNQGFLEKGRQMMLEAAQAEIVQGDLPQAFDDNYEIAD